MTRPSLPGEYLSLRVTRVAPAIYTRDGIPREN